MNLGRSVFSQIMDHLPAYEFQKCVARYRGDSHMRGTLVLGPVFGNGVCTVDLPREPARYRGVPAISGRHASTIWGCAARYRARHWPTPTSRTTGGSSQMRAQVLIAIARPLYAHDPIGIDLDQSLYALDSTTIDLCLSLFPWAKFRQRKAAVKMHTLLDLHGNIPTFIRITDGKVHPALRDQHLGRNPAGGRGVLRYGSRLCGFRTALRVHAQLGLFRGAYQIERLAESGATRIRWTRVPACDPITPSRLTATGSAKAYPDPLRRISYLDAETRKRFKFLTNNFTLPARTIAQIYKSRWQVELFFKWIKQHLRIKAFYGTSENAVKTQIWIAVSVYVVVAIIRKRLGLKASQKPNSTDFERHTFRENAHVTGT